MSPAKVSEQRNGIDDVEIEISEAGLSRVLKQVRTADDGKFSVQGLKAGHYALIVGQPDTTNPQAKSYFESRSNMRVELQITHPDKTRVHGDPHVYEFANKDGVMVRKANHEAQMGAIRNLKREAKPKDDEILVDLASGETIEGRVTLVAPKP